MKLLHKYKNGNVNVEIYDDGTKVREWPDDETPVVEYPESCDLKITQYCDLGVDGAGICKYCHEQSNKKGQHADLDLITSIWATQMPGTELAIGGGNPLAHPQLSEFLFKMKEFGIICNVTVNIMHMRKYHNMIKALQESKLIYGLGISYRGLKSLDLLPPDIDYNNVVFHMIMGIHTLGDCYNVIKWCEDRKIKPKLLLLGYKTFGNGQSCFTPELSQVLKDWNDIYLKLLLEVCGTTISFDNLAISQVNLVDKLTKEQWELLFQGLDSTHTFYIDAVKQEVAGTSTSAERFPIKAGEHISDVFNKVKLK